MYSYTNNTFDFNQIFHTASFVVRLACDLNGDPKKKGAYLALGHPKTGEPEIVVRIGEINNPVSALKYAQLAPEKTIRLGQNPTHLRSLQSRELSLNRFGGGVRLHSGINALSGLPELWDEAAVMGLDYAFYGKVGGIFKTVNIEEVFNDNPYLQPLFDAIDVYYQNRGLQY